MTTQIQPVLTIDDLDCTPDDGNKYELIEGDIYVSRAPSLTHQIVLACGSGGPYDRGLPASWSRAGAGRKFQWR